MCRFVHSVVAFQDPATGESDTGDYASITVVGKVYDGFMYVLESFIERYLPEQQIEAAVQLHRRWGYQTLLIEGNGFQTTLRHSYQQRFKDVVDAPRILSCTQHGNKILRIAELQPYVANGYLLFREDIESKLIEQFRYFPTATHDDGPDALEGAVKQLIPRVPPGRPTIGQRRRIDKRRQIDRQH